MNQPHQPSRVRASSEGLKKLKNAKESQRDDDGKRLSYPRITEKAQEHTYMSKDTVERFFEGKGVYRANAEAIARVLNLQLADIVEPSEAEPPAANSELDSTLSIHRQSCQEMLEKRQRLTTNPLTGGSGMTFNSKDIYVPLGLVERKQKPKHSGDVSPEKGSKLSAPTEYEITRKFENDEFFEQVLKLGESPKSQGRRIAIVGEPGAGKTTRLQQIADWVFEETDGDVAIWVSLADLQGRDLEEYLLQIWLKDALKTARVTPEMEDSLVESFNRGQVWLLLDGVDEMAVDNPLYAIARHLRGWVAEARVVLTCRLNVWDASKNALEDEFDVYRNLDFNLEQVSQFIDNWFANFPERGQLLRAELEQPGKERIQDTVKNPLRLALLCRAWQHREGGLPETKAALYRQFTEALYEWKQESFPTSSAMRRELEAALGRLALGAIDQPSSRFRLTRRQVCEVLGETDAPLFLAACQLGWLNQVGVAAENPDEPVYAFYHPTFEEYFAALAIDDWHFFLKHVPHNLAQGTYRLFEPQWKEVILLWLGRPEEEVSYEQKEKFIDELLNFKDEWQTVYRYQAYFLAAAGISEFKDCSRSDEIVQQILEWNLSVIPKSILEKAEFALKETEHQTVVRALIKSINTETYEPFQIIIDLFKLVGKNNERAINAIFEKLARQNQLNTGLAYLIFQCLSEIAKNNQPAAIKLETILNNSQYPEKIIIAECLEKIQPGNSQALNALIEFLVQQPPEYSPNDIDEDGSPRKEYRFSIHWSVARNLLNSHPKNEKVINAITQLLRVSQNEIVGQDKTEHWLLAIEMVKINPENPVAKNIVNERAQFFHTNTQTKNNKSNNEPINRFCDFTEPEFIDKKWWCLNQTEREQIEKIDLIDDIETLLAMIFNKNRSRGIILNFDFIYARVGGRLQKIALSNPNIIVSLVTNIYNCRKYNEYYYMLVARILQDITPGSLNLVKTITSLLANSDEVFFSTEYIKRMEDLADDVEAYWAIYYPVGELRESATKSLKKILNKELLMVVVERLKDSFSEATYNYNWYCYYHGGEVLWHCAQNMTYLEFYQAWHSQSVTSHPEVLETTEAGANSLTQSLNLAYLPQSLASAIADDSHLSQNVKVICIDGSKFIDPDNPASKIYTEMVKGGCPKCEDGTPKTMPELQAYWDLLMIESDARSAQAQHRTLVLVFYHPQEFSDKFLDVLSKFDGAICIVTSQPMGNFPLQQFSANQPHLVENIVGWIRARVYDALP